MRLDAFLPVSYDDKLCCLISFRETELSKNQITLDEVEIKNSLFINREEGINTNRGFIIGINNDDILIQLGNNRFTVDRYTTEMLCNLIDELYKEYMNKKENLLIMVGGVGFEQVDFSLFKIMSVPNDIWDYMHDFANHHDHSTGNSEWHIFQMYNDKKQIVFYHNKERDSSIIADILCYLVSERGDFYSTLYWKAGYTPALMSNEGFDNIVK